MNLAGDDEFLTTLRNTAAYAVMAVVPGSAVALGLALAVNQALRGMALFRILFFIPVVTSITVISFLWNWIYTPDSTGPLNYLLHYAGIGPQQWLQSSTLALPSLAAFGIWSSAGYTMILWLAGLQTVPVELYDAASVDGANRWQRFRHVTLPMLKPTTIFIVMVGTIGGILMATFLNNSGGAWDNAKKFIETGAYGGKGSETHKAAVVGDTVGDPFKDTAGPSLHVLIKLLSTITLVLAPLFV